MNVIVLSCGFALQVAQREWQQLINMAPLWEHFFFLKKTETSIAFGTLG